MSDAGTLQNYSVDQVAGAIVLVLGAIAGLLQVIWMSKCHCKVNLCYLFRCERRPPSEDEMKTLKKQVSDRKEKKEEKKDREAVEKDKLDDLDLIPPQKKKEEIIDLDEP